MSLREFISREPVEFPMNVEKTVRVGAVVAKNLETGELEKIKGPVDLDRYGPFPMELTSRATGLKITTSGIRLIVVEEDGEPVRKPWNIVSRRLFSQLMGDLETGNYLRYRYAVTAIGEPPRRRYQVRRVPIG